MRCCHVLAFVVLLAATLTGTLAAQPLWPTPLTGQAELGLEWVRPTFANGDDQFGFSRGVWIVSGRLRATDRLNVVVALPHLRAPGESFFGAETAFGNPYVGIEFLTAERRPEFSLGVRLGSISDNAFGPAVMGLFGDFDRWEAAVPNVITINAIGHTTPWKDDEGASVQVRFGGTFLHPKDADAADANELYVDYGIRFAHDGPAVHLGAALTGRWLAISGGGGSLAETTIHQVAGDITVASGTVRPLLGVRIPLDDDLDEVVKYVLIGGVTVALR